MYENCFLKIFEKRKYKNRKDNRNFKNVNLRKKLKEYSEVLCSIIVSVQKIHSNFVMYFEQN